MGAVNAVPNPPEGFIEPDQVEELVPLDVG